MVGEVAVARLEPALKPAVFRVCVASARDQADPMALLKAHPLSPVRTMGNAGIDNLELECLTKVDSGLDVRRCPQK